MTTQHYWYLPSRDICRPCNEESMRMQEEVQARLRTIRDRTTELVNHLTQVSSMIHNTTPEDEEDAATFNYYINVLDEMVPLIVEIRGR